MDEKENDKITIPIDVDTTELENKLERIKKLLGDIKESAQEVKDLFKHFF